MSQILQPEPPSPPVRRFNVAISGLTREPPESPVISPDGRQIVYVQGGELWLRELRVLAPRLLLGNDTFCIEPFWPPDIAFVGYFADAKLWNIPVEGGQPTLLASLPGRILEPR